MSLNTGQKAPTFKVKDIWGQDVVLGRSATQVTLLSFFRFADCPMCNMRVSEMMRHKNQISAQNIQVIAVFESSVENIKKSIVDRHQFGFTIISDPQKTLYTLFGVEPSWWKMMKSMGPRGIMKMIKAKRQGFNLMGNVDGALNQIPADFLIDHNGLIKVAYYGNDIADHLPFDEILLQNSNVSHV